MNQSGYEVFLTIAVIFGMVLGIATLGIVMVRSQNANPMGTGPLRDAAGNLRRALFRLGSPGMGTMSDEVSVEWES